MNEQPTITRAIALGLEGFGRTALEDRRRALNVSVAALLRQAVLYFLSLRGSDRTAPRVPRFALRDAPPTTFTVGLELAACEWSDLEAESARLRLPLELVVEHSALLFLADIDSGRLVARIAARDGQREQPSV